MAQAGCCLARPLTCDCTHLPPRLLCLLPARHLTCPAAGAVYLSPHTWTPREHRSQRRAGTMGLGYLVQGLSACYCVRPVARRGGGRRSSSWRRPRGSLPDQAAVVMSGGGSACGGRRGRVTARGPRPLQESSPGPRAPPSLGELSLLACSLHSRQAQGPRARGLRPGVMLGVSRCPHPTGGAAQARTFWWKLTLGSSESGQQV